MKKKFFGTIFWTVGSCVLAFVLVVVGLNFYKDSRTLNKTVEVVKNEVPVQKEDTFDKEKFEMIEIDRSAYERISDPLKNKDTKNTKIKVYVINYTGNKKLTTELKSTLKAGGFEVSVEDAKPDKNAKTTIIEKNDKKAGTKVLSILKVGKIIKELDAKSKYDVMIKIGDDYLP